VRKIDAAQVLIRDVVVSYSVGVAKITVGAAPDTRPGAI